MVVALAKELVYMQARDIRAVVFVLLLCAINAGVVSFTCVAQ